MFSYIAKKKKSRIRASSLRFLHLVPNPHWRGRLVTREKIDGGGVAFHTLDSSRKCIIYEVNIQTSFHINLLVGRLLREGWSMSTSFIAPITTLV